MLKKETFLILILSTDPLIFDFIKSFKRFLFKSQVLFFILISALKLILT